jgi:drug/metabolite transporter (DMT)-like permease
MAAARMTTSSLLSRLAPPLFVLIWATGFVVARLVAPHAEPLTFLLLRYGLAILVLVAVAVAVRAPWPATRRGWQDGLVAGVLLHGCYLGGVFWAVKHGLPAGIAALIAGLQPLATGLIVGPLLGETVTTRRWFGIGVGFLGAALVIAPKLGTTGGFSVLPLSVCLLATISITFGTVWQKRTGVAADLRTGTVVQYIGAALVTLPVALATEDLRLDFVPALWFGLLWAVLGLSIGGIGLLLVLIRRGAVAGVASLLYLVPPVSALMAYGLFGETLSPLQVVGMVVAAGGVAIASRG